MSKPQRLMETLTLAQTPIPDELWQDVAQLSTTRGDGVHA
jgi:hypothetical protein